MTNQDFFSVNRAARLLGHTRKTVTRALAAIPPDIEEDSTPRWHLRVIVDALQATRDRNAERQDGGQRRMIDLVNSIEKNFKKFSAGVKLLEAESSVEKRRMLDAEHNIGKLIGTLDEQMIQVNRMVPAGTMLTVVSDKMIGALASKFLTLIDMWPGELKAAALGDRR